MKEPQHESGWKTVPSTSLTLVHFTHAPFTYLLRGLFILFFLPFLHWKTQEMPRKEYISTKERRKDKFKTYTSMFGSDGKDREVSSRKRAFA
jgi:hypothetical protein